MKKKSTFYPCILCIYVLSAMKMCDISVSSFMKPNHCNVLHFGTAFPCPNFKRSWPPIYLYVLVFKIKKKKGFQVYRSYIFMFDNTSLFFCKSRYSWYSTFFLSLILISLKYLSVSVVSYLEYLSISSE